MKIKIFNIEENISEKEFPKYMEGLGYSCKKIKSTNINSISKKLGETVKFEKGITDFFIWNEKEMYLCEFKSKNDAWRISQIIWAVKNNKLPIAIALVNLEKEETKEVDLEIDSEDFELSKEHEVKIFLLDMYFKEYANKNPKKVGVEFFEYYNKKGDRFFLGAVPKEVGIKWDLIEKLFKDKQRINYLISLYEENKLKTSKDVDLLLQR
jgi:hypothetical protein